MKHLALNGGTPVRSRPFPRWPQHGAEEEQNLIEVLQSGVWGGYHPKVCEFEKAWAMYCGAKEAVLAVNGTVTLVAALLAMGVKPGGEVIVPPLTFAATATAVSLAGATPVFVDIEARTLNLDPEQIEAACTDRTSAVLPVHFAGQMADMDRIGAIAASRSLKVLEDAAHAHGSEWRGRRAGSFGDAASFSFQNSKVMTSGEGGIVVSSDEGLVDRVRSYINQGRRAGGGWFEHFALGTNLRISAFQAAVLLAQYDRLDSQIEKRTQNARWLISKLGSIPFVKAIETSAAVTRHSHYLLPLHFEPDVLRTTFPVLLKAIQAEGIPLLSYPHPVYRNEVFKEVPSRIMPCPVVERMIKEAGWVPGYALLGEEEDVADILTAFGKVADHMNELP